MKKIYNILLVTISMMPFINTTLLTAQVKYKVIDLGTLGGISSYAVAINDSGEIVGTSYLDNDNFSHGFFWKNDIMYDIGNLGGHGGASAINNKGQVAGTSYKNDGGNSHAFFWQQDESILDLDPEGDGSYAYGINDNGVVVGTKFFWLDQFNGSYAYRAVKWLNGALQDLGINADSGVFTEARAINASSQIVGFYHSDIEHNYPGSFLLDNGNITKIDQLIAVDINDNGEVLCNLLDATLNPIQHCVLWQNGAIVKDLGNFSGRSINNKGDIVGATGSGLDWRAMLYRDGTLINLNDVSDTTGGWVLGTASDINDKGEIVGYDFHTGIYHAFLLKPNSLTITKPKAEELFIAGETDTIKWMGGDKNDLVQIEYSLDSGKTFNFIDFDIPADTDFYIWNIPDSLLSRKAIVRIVNIVDTSQTISSDLFKIKGYVLTRLDANGDYVAYNITKDRWGFGNNANDMWPLTWYQRFKYGGLDPFTGVQYSQWQGNSVFANALSSEFPDWEAFVRAFSEVACYVSTSSATYSPTALSRWSAVKSKWGGSCFGIAAANALAFSYKDQFITGFPSFPSFTDPIAITSNTKVIPVISELFSHQFGNPTKQRIDDKWDITPNETLNEAKQMFLKDNVPIRTLVILNNNGSGGHGILPYGLERDKTQKELYYLYVYDNSHPNNTTALILIDTTGNANQGTWLTTYGWTNWGGSKHLFLEVPAINYLSNAILPKRNKNYQSPFIMQVEDLDIYVNTDANTRIIDGSGNVTGYMNGDVVNDIPNSIPLIYLNGSETPPYGYSLTTDNYSVQIDSVESDTLKTFFFTGNKTFTYERTGVNNTQTDRLFFDGGVSVSNRDQDNKSISLVNIINESSQEKLFTLRNISLAQNDSVKIENPDDNRLNFISYGSGKTYGVELNFATELGLGRFVNDNITITPNTTHQLVPNWGDFAGLGLTIYVDKDNNGTIDDTLNIGNTVDVKDQGNLNIPDEYRLEQNYPNPFNPVTTIRYSIPKTGVVVLKVYNAIGEEIASLVNEEKSPGNYELKWDASNLSSGIYFYKLQAGNFVETKKMVLIK